MRKRCVEMLWISPVAYRVLFPFLGLQVEMSSGLSVNSARLGIEPAEARMLTVCPPVSASFPSVNEQVLCQHRTVFCFAFPFETVLGGLQRQNRASCIKFYSAIAV